MGFPDVDLAALLAERERHLAALEALDVGVVIADVDLSPLFVNRVARAFLTDPTSLDPPAHEVVHEDGSPWPLVERPIADAVRDGVTTLGVVMGVRADDGTRWLRVDARPLVRPGEDTPYAGLVVFTDMTDQRAAEAALRESEAHFRLLAENSTDVISRHSPDGRPTYVSPALTDLLGREPADIEGRAADTAVHPDDKAALAAMLRGLLHSRSARTLRYRMRHRDGSWVWVETVARPVVDDDGRVVEILGATRDISSRIDSEQRLSRLALVDPLTGLANRSALTQRLEDEVSAGGRVALLFLDLDRFKVVNDSLGHSAGDELLRTIAGRLAGACRDGDLVARLGGDEFVVVAAGLDEEGALALSDRVQKVLRAPVEVAGHELIMTASVGIVVNDPDGDADADGLLRDADVSMYRAKAKGRARAVVWNEALAGAAPERLELERDLRTALDGDGLVVLYQPQVELETGRIVGVEALVRWQHPQRGLLAPDAFLDVAEDTGLVVPLGRVVLSAAARQVAAWRALPGHEHLRLSVNRSAQELVEPGALETALAVLADAGLPARALTVEVLESVLLDSDGDVSRALAAWVDAGVQLALDDFGTGTSSLLQLRRVPVRSLKLDRAFVAGVGRSRQDEAIVRAVRQLADDLALRLVAEGVEEDVQRDWLAAQGVPLGQGYLLHRPLTARQVEALLSPERG